jgi:hypothetical protein
MLNPCIGFYLNLPLGGAVALLLLLIRIPNEREKETSSWANTLRQLDLVGFAAFAPAIIMLLLALSWGGSTYQWKSAKIIGLLCGAAVLFYVFLGWEYHKGDGAMIPLKLLWKRTISASLINGMLGGGALMQMNYFVPLWFQVVKNDSPTMSGVAMLPTVGSQMVFVIICGFLGEFPDYVFILTWPEIVPSEKNWVLPAFRSPWECNDSCRSRYVQYIASFERCW